MTTQLDLAEIIEEFGEHCQAIGNRPRTVELRTLTVTRIASLAAVRYPETPFIELERRQLETVLNKLKITSGSRAEYRTSLVQFWRYCAMMRYVPNAEPAEHITKSRKNEPNPNPVTDDELRRLMNNALAVQDLRMAALISLGAYAGLRVDEMARCHSSWFDWDEPGYPVLKIEGKGGKRRVVPMHDEVARWCNAYGIPDDGYLFRSFYTDADGKPCNDGHLSAAYTSRLIGEFMVKCGVQKTAHKLRHRFATEIYRKTRDIEVTSRLLGHALLEITRRYVKSTTSDDYSHRAVAML